MLTLYENKYEQEVHKFAKSKSVEKRDDHTQMAAVRLNIRALKPAGENYGNIISNMFKL